MAAHAESGVPTDTECVYEHPVQVLAAAAETARLLVIGMDGGNRFDDVLVPSLALDACAAASCPVVIVRGPESPIPTDGPVVLGLDDVGRDAAAITAAFADAGGPATTLVIIHVLHGPDAILDAVAGHPTNARAAAEEEIMTALSPWRSRHPGVPVEVRVMHGTPFDQLLEAAAPARLLVVGTHGHGQAARLVLGSTSRAVARSRGAARVRSWSYLKTRTCSTSRRRTQHGQWWTPPSPHRGRGACGRTTAVNCGDRIAVGRHAGDAHRGGVPGG